MRTANVEPEAPDDDSKRPPSDRGRARLLLERASEDGAYRATIYTPTEMFTAAAQLGEHGSVSLAATGAAAELHAALEMLARLTARGVEKRREDGMPAWPARVLGWRGTGRGL